MFAVYAIGCRWVVLLGCARSAAAVVSSCCATSLSLAVARCSPVSLEMGMRSCEDGVVVQVGRYWEAWQGWTFKDKDRKADGGRSKSGSSCGAVP